MAAAAALLVVVGVLVATGQTTSAAKSPAQAPAQAAERPYCERFKCVAITYDDGPAAPTGRLLTTLRQKRAKATFFVLGQQVAARPKLARRIVRNGHQIGVHTWDHPDLTRLNSAGVRRQLWRTIDAIEHATDVRTHLMRPPYGATDATVKEAARRAKLAQILWSVDTEDWRVRDADIVVRRVLSQARRGSIVLMHDIHPTTADAAGRIIDGLRARGFRLVTVSKLLGATKPGEVYFSR